MKSKARVALLLSVAIAGPACSKVTYVNPGTMPSGRVVVSTGHFFLFGLAGHHDIDGVGACPTGIAAVVSKFTFLDSVLGFITLGLYAPRTYALYCGQERAVAVGGGR